MPAKRKSPGSRGSGSRGFWNKFRKRHTAAPTRKRTSRKRRK